MFHSTSMRRSGSASSTWGQSLVWTVTPRPRVMKPTTGSPGRGSQHLAKRTMMSSTPWILMAPEGFLRIFSSTLPMRPPLGVSDLSFSWGTTRPMICPRDTLPYPSPASRSSALLNPSSETAPENSSRSHGPVQAETVLAQFLFQQLPADGNTVLPLLGLDPLADFIAGLGGTDEFEPVLAGGLVGGGQDLDDIPVVQLGAQGHQLAVDLAPRHSAARRRCEWL